jgi:hypothetical protein
MDMCEIVGTLSFESAYQTFSLALCVGVFSANLSKGILENHVNVRL